jgi:hypothetical protein
MDRFFGGLAGSGAGRPGFSFFAIRCNSQERKTDLGVVERVLC